MQRRQHVDRGGVRDGEQPERGDVSIGDEGLEQASHDEQRMSERAPVAMGARRDGQRGDERAGHQSAQEDDLVGRHLHQHKLHEPIVDDEQRHRRAHGEDTAERRLTVGRAPRGRRCRLGHVMSREARLRRRAPLGAGLQVVRGEPADRQRGDVEPGLALYREIRRHFAQHRAELVAMARAGRDGDDLRCIRQGVDDEMLVRRHGVHAALDRQRIAGGVGQVAGKALLDRGDLLRARRAVGVVGVDRLAREMRAAELEAGVLPERKP